MKSLFLSLALLMPLSAFAGNSDIPECRGRNGDILNGNINHLRSVMGNPRSNRAQVYVTGTIVEIRAEDHSGLPHQKFDIQVDTKTRLQIVTNLDFERIPLVLGKKVSICGEFLRVGDGMVHWTHFDPHGNHPDGFTLLDGVVYGDVETPN